MSEGVRVGVSVEVAVKVGVRVAVEVAVKVAVAVTGDGGTASTAFAASTMPLPQVEMVQVLPAGKASAVVWRIWMISERVSARLIESINEMTPLTCGAAMLVPAK